MCFYQQFAISEKVKALGGPGDWRKVIYLITLEPVFVTSSSDFKSSGLSLISQCKGRRKPICGLGVLSLCKFYCYLTSNIENNRQDRQTSPFFPVLTRLFPDTDDSIPSWKCFPGAGIGISHENRCPYPILLCGESTGLFPSLLGQGQVPLQHPLGRRRTFKLP